MRLGSKGDKVGLRMSTTAKSACRRCCGTYLRIDHQCADQVGCSTPGRAVNAPHLVALVRPGAIFHKGKLLERLKGHSTVRQRMRGRSVLRGAAAHRH